MLATASLLRSAPEGAFAGYASVFGALDRGHDIVTRGAFRRSLDERGSAGIKLLWQHDPARPIGRVVNLTEDGIGMKMVAALSPDCRDGRDALALLRSGAVDGLSFGYRVKSARPRPAGGRELLKLELIECSVVTLPMHGEARIEAVG